MHLCPLIVMAFCVRETVSSDRHQSVVTHDPLQTAVAARALHSAFLSTATILRTAAPIIAAIMPDKAPLVFGACSGCSALATRFPDRPAIGEPEQQGRERKQSQPLALDLSDSSNGRVNGTAEDLLQDLFPKTGGS